MNANDELEQQWMRRKPPAEHWEVWDRATSLLLQAYIDRMELPTEQLCVTTEKSRFEAWLGRRIGSAGGAYAWHPAKKRHLILINLSRIDLAKPKALEIVVAEELIHMRDWINGDRRRHSRHGYDRIATRVAGLTGATLDDVRNCLLPTRASTVRHRYQCPQCRREWVRKRRGMWACGNCTTLLQRPLQLRLIESIRIAPSRAEVSERD